MVLSMEQKRKLCLYSCVKEKDKHALVWSQRKDKYLVYVWQINFMFSIKYFKHFFRGFCKFFVLQMFPFSQVLNSFSMGSIRKTMCRLYWGPYDHFGFKMSSSFCALGCYCWCNPRSEEGDMRRETRSEYMGIIEILTMELREKLVLAHML